MTAVLGRILQGFVHCFFLPIVFSLESARSNNSMSVGACAVVDIGLSKYFKVFSGHSAGQHPTLEKLHYREVVNVFKNSEAIFSSFSIIDIQ